MKSVLLSIKPKYCELIAAGKKTIEVRKTKPKLETPFKCYIYCTKPKNNAEVLWTGANCVIGKMSDQSNGKVIGEFVCDGIILMADSGVYFASITDYDVTGCCLNYRELHKYGNGKNLYGWHISDLVIYDKPKELNAFKKINRECWYADLGLAKRDCEECKNADCLLTRPPQSWCYVMEVKE